MTKLLNFGECHPGEDAPIDSKGFENALYTMDIGHNDLMGVLHLSYDEILRKLPPIVAEIRKAIEVHLVQVNKTVAHMINYSQ